MKISPAKAQKTQSVPGSKAPPLRLCVFAGENRGGPILPNLEDSLYLTLGQVIPKCYLRRLL
jgi:hypothetical protein